MVAMRFGMTSGNGSRILWRAAPRANAAGARTTDCFLMRCCGWPLRAIAGVTCPHGLAITRAVKRRYYRWIEMGVLDEMLSVLARDADLERLMIDSTIVRRIRMRPAHAS